MKDQKINIPTCLVLIVYPILLIILAILYIKKYSIGSFEVLLFVVSYYVCNITVGIGFHRLWAHNSYKVNKYVELILVILSAGTLQGPALSWASNHYNHHTYTDDIEKDPHTPLKYKSKIKGFFWSHIGWMLVGEGSYKSISRVTMVKLGRNPLLRWQIKHYWMIATVMNTIVPISIGYLIGGNLVSAYAGFLFIGLGRAVQQEMTFCANSVCHFFGKQQYTTDTSRDIWWLAPFLLGENWHNYHHAFPSDYRNGAKWYQLDIHKWIIYLLSVFGLAWDLDTTDDVRVRAKMLSTEKVANTRKKKLDSLKVTLAALLDTIKAKYDELGNQSKSIQEKIGQSLIDIQNQISALQRQIVCDINVKKFEIISDVLVKSMSESVESIELSVKDILGKIENLRNHNSAALKSK